MSGSSAKANRKLAKEVAEVLRPDMEARIDQIEEYVKPKMEAMDKRAKAIQSWIIQEVKVKIQQDLFDAKTTVDAIVMVLAQSNLSIPDFDAKVQAAKQVIAAQITQKASDDLTAEMQRRNDEVLAAQTPSQQ